MVNVRRSDSGWRVPCGHPKWAPKKHSVGHGFSEVPVNIGSSPNGSGSEHLAKRVQYVVALVVTHRYDGRQ